MANDEPPSSSSLQLVLEDRPSAVGFPLGTSSPDSTALVDLWTSRRSTATGEAQIESYFTFEKFVRFYKKMEEVETSWMEEDIKELYEASAYGTTVVGYCYAIWNRLFDTLIKIGMTKRTPEIRVKELSGTGMPEPFEIVAVLECRNPVLMERAIHAHYDSVRKYGKKKEFFTLTREEVAEYFKSLTAVAMEGPAADPLSKKMKKNRSGMPSMGMEPSSGIFEMFHFQLTADGEVYDIPYVVTTHGHILIKSSAYAVPLVGCKSKNVSRKVSAVAVKIPELDHKERNLVQHDKVIRKQVSLPLVTSIEVGAEVFFVISHCCLK
jgi:hypothetical protein